MEGGRTKRDFSDMNADGYTAEEMRDAESMGVNLSMPSSSPQAQADTSAGSNMQTVGQAGMMTGNPYLMAGGLALQTIGGAKNRELQREQQNINNEIARRDRVMQLMANLGSGFGRLG